MNRFKKMCFIGLLSAVSAVTITGCSNKEGDSKAADEVTTSTQSVTTATTSTTKQSETDAKTTEGEQDEKTINSDSEGLADLIDEYNYVSASKKSSDYNLAYNLEMVFSQTAKDYETEVGEIGNCIKFDASDIENSLEADFDIDKEKFVDLWKKNNGDEEYEPRCYKNDSFIAELNVDGDIWNYTISYKNHPEDSLDPNKDESSDIIRTDPKDYNDKEKYDYLVTYVSYKLPFSYDTDINERFSTTISEFEEKSKEIGYTTSATEKAWLEEALRMAEEEEKNDDSDFSYHKPKGEVEVYDYKNANFLKGIDPYYWDSYISNANTMNEVFDGIIFKSDFKNITEEDLQDYIEETKSFHERYACMYGIKYDDLIKMCARDEVTYEDLLDSEKEHAVKLNLVINEIAKRENISVSEEEFEEEIAASYAARGFNSAEECIAIFGKDDIMQGMLQMKVYAHIISYSMDME